MTYTALIAQLRTPRTAVPAAAVRTDSPAGALFSYRGLLIHVRDSDRPDTGAPLGEGWWERLTVPYVEDGVEGPAVAREFYRYEAPTPPGEHRSLIVARMAPHTEHLVAGTFAESDAGELPALVGVTQRILLRLGTLYLHLIEGVRPVGPAVARHRDHSAFTVVNELLAEYIAPYDPATWRSPADAMATQIHPPQGLSVG